MPLIPTSGIKGIMHNNGYMAWGCFSKFNAIIRLKHNKLKTINKHEQPHISNAEIITFLFQYRGCDIKRKTAEGIEN